jgi:hypothetical protein
VQSRSPAGPAHPPTRLVDARRAPIAASAHRPTKEHALPEPTPQPSSRPPGTQALYDAFGATRAELATAHPRGTAAYETAWLVIRSAEELDRSHKNFADAIDRAMDTLRSARRRLDRPNSLGVLQLTGLAVDLAAASHDRARMQLDAAIHTHRSVVDITARTATTPTRAPAHSTAAQPVAAAATPPMTPPRSR